MVAISQVLLASENFSENAATNLKQLWTSKEFTDVTLVSGDGFKLQAHKTVLSSSSSFFREILSDNHHPSVLLYMRGVTLKELELLLRFTYTGECQVEATELKSFLKTGEELGLQGLLENSMGGEVSRMMENPKIGREATEQPPETEVNKGRNIPSDLRSEIDLGSHIDVEEYLDEKPRHLSAMNTNMVDDAREEATEESDTGFNYVPSNVELPLGEKFERALEECFDGAVTKTNAKRSLGADWICVDCSKTFTCEQRLEAHMTGTHGAEAVCKTCGFKTSTLQSISRHRIKMHGGKLYKCDQCTFQSSDLFQARKHKQNKHAGFIESKQAGFKPLIRYRCDQCDNSYAQKRAFLNHIESKHSGVLFKCDYCDHEARTDVLLKKHISRMKMYNEEAHKEKA